MPDEQGKHWIRVYSRTDGESLRFFDTDPDLIAVAALEGHPREMKGFDGAGVRAIATLLTVLSPGDEVRIKRVGGKRVWFSVYHMTQERYDGLPYPEDIEEDKSDA